MHGSDFVSLAHNHGEVLAYGGLAMVAYDHSQANTYSTNLRRVYFCIVQNQIGDHPMNVKEQGIP